MELLTNLFDKEKLDTDDVLALLNCLQEQTTPLLSPKQPLTTREKDQLSHHDSKRSELSASCTPFQRDSSAHRARGTRSRDSSAKKREGRSAGRVGSVRGGLLSNERGCSARGEKVSLDLNNEDEFPPMTPAGGPNSQRKPNANSGPPRRITPTPLQSHSHSLTTFTAPLTTSPSPWKRDPAFTTQTASSNHPHSLSEEQDKRQKQNRSSQRSKSRQSTQSFESSSPSAHLQRLEQRMSGTDSLDSKISGHSIFNLTHSPDNTRRKQSVVPTHLDPTSKCPVETNQLVSGTHTDSAQPLTSVCSGNTRPLTSTPADKTRPLTSTPVQPSLERVTNAEVLQRVAVLYSGLIKEGRVPNLTSEVHFVIQLLTLSEGKTASQHRVLQDAPLLFESVSNCVYFAVNVLGEIRHLVCHVDQPTLQLLADNPRVAAISLELSTFFSEACQNVRQETPHEVKTTPTTNRVPFMEEQDSSKNFPTMRAFHAFKKQRDLFYTIFREWEGNHDNHGWSFKETQEDNIRVLIRQHGEACSLSHLANLFKRQLIESCKQSSVSDDIASSYLSDHANIKNTDPHRLRRLTERFFLPPTSGAGPCPPPSFSPVEEFFRAFIVEADSFVFNQHLRDALYAELEMLHQSCSSPESSRVLDLLQLMRSLAKFLGLLEFHPYSPTTVQPTTGRETHPCNIGRFVAEAKVKGHLCLTLPWVVQYLSMLDPQAVHVECHRQLLLTLMEEYREMLSSPRPFTTSRLLIVTCLGWLFENPHIPSELFFGQLSRSPSDQAHSTPAVKDSIDSQTDVITTNVLYTCCPYLNEIRSLLTEFASGLHSRPSPLRKIKPISTSIHKPESSVSKQLQVQLRETFFHGHPPYLKQLCAVTSERVASMAIDHCRTTLLSAALPEAMCLLGNWMREKWSVCPHSNENLQLEDTTTPSVDPFSKDEAETRVLHAVGVVYPSLFHNVVVFSNRYCESEPRKILELLLADSLQIVPTVAKICAELVREKVTKWIESKLKNLLHGELIKSVERVKRSLKATVRAGSLHGRAATLGCDGEETHPGSSCEHSLGQQHTCRMVERGSVLIQKFKEVSDGLLRSTASYSSEDLLTVHQLVDYLEQTAYIMPRVPLPHAVPFEGKDVGNFSMDLVTHLISQGLLSPSNKDGSQILSTFRRLWTCLKGQRSEVPYQDFLSTGAFEKYLMSEEVEEVWLSLAAVLTELVRSDLVPSSLLEGVWLCRHLQLPKERHKMFLRGVAVFLSYWYNSDPSSPQSEALDRTSTVAVFTHIHFTRLLGVVVSQLDHELVPKQLLSMETAAMVLPISK